MTAEFSLPAQLGSVTLSAAPEVGAITPEGVWEHLGSVYDEEDDRWILVFATLEEGFAGSLVGSETERGPVALHTTLDLGVSGDFLGHDYQWRFEAEGIGVLWEPPLITGGS
jgi:hypothetical protein